MQVLQASGLRFTYRGAREPALRGLDLEVGEGEIVGLLGPNGAGKPTAISLCTGLLPCREGEIRHFGQDLRRAPVSLRRRLGLVPQEVALYGTLTVEENLRFFGRLLGLRGGDLDRGVALALERTFLDDVRDRPVRTLSGGLRRRANLAAGLVHGPGLLFLDEPTVGVDTPRREAILESLARLAREGLSMLYTTHYLEEAERLCHRVVIMDRGRVLVAGTPGTLRERHPGCPDLRALFLDLTGRDVRD